MIISTLNYSNIWEVVVAQLVERSLPTPEVRGSNPVISKIYMYHQLYWKDENKEKKAGKCPIFKKTVVKKNKIKKIEAVNGPLIFV